MRDPRIDKLAKTLVCFSTDVRGGDNVLIQATDANPELVKALASPSSGCATRESSARCS